MHLEPMGLQCALMDLSHAIVKGMFECLHYFPAAMGVQKDLHDQGKRVNNNRGDGQDCNCASIASITVTGTQLLIYFNIKMTPYKCQAVHPHQAYFL